MSHIFCWAPGVLDTLRIPAGDSYSSRGQRPRKLAFPRPDPEGVEEKALSQQCLTPQTSVCDPCRVARWVGNPSGGVAPGYCLMPLQGIVLGRPTTSHLRGHSLSRVLTPGVQPRAAQTLPFMSAPHCPRLAQTSKTMSAPPKTHLKWQIENHLNFAICHLPFELFFCFFTVCLGTVVWPHTSQS